MSSSIPSQKPGPGQQDWRVEARRWVRKRFYWPMLGTGAVVAVTAIVLLGVGGLQCEG